MELNERELKVMRSGFKRFVHRNIELRTFQKLGLKVSGKRLLELGCGDGFGATLLLSMKPQSYTGIDVSLSQLEAARAQHRSGAQFLELDASRLDAFEDASQDLVVVFRILHHMPQWRQSVKECFRVLSPGGQLFVVEPYKGLTKLADRFLRWQHPPDALFTVGEFRGMLQVCGFDVRMKSVGFGFATVATKPS